MDPAWVGSGHGSAWDREQRKTGKWIKTMTQNKGDEKETEYK